jgi:hypothetical protein
MYSSYLDQCEKGMLSVISENSKGLSTVRLYEGVTPRVLLDSMFSTNNFSAVERESALQLALPSKDSHLLVLHAPPLVIPFTTPLSSCEASNVTRAAYEFCHGGSAFDGGCEAQLFVRVHGLLNRWCDHTDKQRQAQVQISVDTTPLPMEITVVIKTIGRDSIGAAVDSALREQFKVLIVCDGADASRKISGTMAPYAGREGIQIITLGRRWGFYGSVAANVGAYISNTAFIAFLDDDDELAVGAGDILRRRLEEEPDVDIWIPPITYNDGRVHCSTQCGMFKRRHRQRRRAPSQKNGDVDGGVGGDVDGGVGGDVDGGGGAEEMERQFRSCMATEPPGLVQSNICVPIYRTKVFARMPFTHTVSRGTDYLSMGGAVLPQVGHLLRNARC